VWGVPALEAQSGVRQSAMAGSGPAARGSTAERMGLLQSEAESSGGPADRTASVVVPAAIVAAAMARAMVAAIPSRRRPGAVDSVQAAMEAPDARIVHGRAGLPARGTLFIRPTVDRMGRAAGLSGFPAGQSVLRPAEHNGRILVRSAERTGSGATGSGPTDRRTAVHPEAPHQQAEPHRQHARVRVALEKTLFPTVRVKGVARVRRSGRRVPDRRIALRPTAFRPTAVRPTGTRPTTRPSAEAGVRTPMAGVRPAKGVGLAAPAASHRRQGATDTRMDQAVRRGPRPELLGPTGGASARRRLAAARSSTVGIGRPTGPRPMVDRSAMAIGRGRGARPGSVIVGHPTDRDPTALRPPVLATPGPMSVLVRSAPSGQRSSARGQAATVEKTGDRAHPVHRALRGTRTGPRPAGRRTLRTIAEPGLVLQQLKEGTVVPEHAEPMAQWEEPVATGRVSVGHSAVVNSTANLSGMTGTSIAPVKVPAQPPRPPISVVI